MSIGNLIVGGSGKTPFLIALAKEFDKIAVVTRGYGRESKGTFVVSRWGEIVCDVTKSGDEAMMIAKSLPKASVIVCEKREEGIALAKELGAQAVFLDDAFHAPIKKFDIVIDPNPPNRWCLPAGPYRLPRFFLQKVDMVVQEKRDFWRRSRVRNATPKMVLLTAIANPKRLDSFLPQVVAKYYFVDHHFFTQQELQDIWQKERPTSFLVTPKDAVKLERFSYPLSLLELEIELKPKIIKRVQKYLKEHDAKKTTDSSDPA